MRIFGRGGRKQVAIGRAEPKFEVMDAESLSKILEKEAAVLLYGSLEEQKKTVLGFISSSNDLIAIVNCRDLQSGHRQIAVNRPLGESSYKNIAEMGFLPDLIIARCADVREAISLIEWTVLGPKLICMVEPKAEEHKRWSSLGQFSLQVFCGADGTFVIGRVTSSPQLPS